MHKLHPKSSSKVIKSYADGGRVKKNEASRPKADRKLGTGLADKAARGLRGRGATLKRRMKDAGA